MHIRENIFKRTQSLFSVLRLVWDCKPRLVVLIFILTIISSIIPFVQTVIAKYILDSIIAAVGSRGAWIDVRAVLIFVGMEFGLVVVSRFLGQYLDLKREILGEIFSKDSSIRVINKAVSLDLSYFEDSEYYDKLQKAQRDGNYRPVQLLNQLFTLLENIVSIGSFFTLLLTFKWYFLFLILLAVVPPRYFPSNSGMFHSPIRRRTMMEMEGYMQATGSIKIKIAKKRFLVSSLRSSLEMTKREWPDMRRATRELAIFRTVGEQYIAPVLRIATIQTQ